MSGPKTVVAHKLKQCPKWDALEMLQKKVMAFKFHREIRIKVKTFIYKSIKF